ncbi:helix-turn-helix domain-containing protein [Rhodococcus sp. NPDC058505]|uniref:helix-turn-helix domain-containing protein n=1 Tax=unclassified Rhodococcus (in: high G+C Gram-positive bacteria) TaxID=192944 RepID=UPI0036647479
MTRATLSIPRLTLVHAAERLVAERGLHGVRASEVVKAAGHKNNSAITYHFGSWENLLVAVWDLHTVPVNAARAALIATARAEHDYTRAAMVRAYVLPLVTEVRRNRPSHWARFNEQWLATLPLDIFDLDAAATAQQPRTESVTVVHDLFTDIAGTLTHLDPPARSRRVALMARFVIAALAAWERGGEHPQPLDDLERELLSTGLALLQAP